MVADDPARLLSPVLQGMKAERDKVRGIGQAHHTVNAALFLELVVIEGVRGRHGLFAEGHGHGQQVRIQFQDGSYLVQVQHSVTGAIPHCNGFM